MGKEHITHIGRTDFRGDDRLFGIKDEDRLLHIYITSCKKQHTKGVISPSEGLLKPQGERTPVHR